MSPKNPKAKALPPDAIARGTDGRFSKGNRFWEARSRHGSFPVFDGPVKLAEACTDYFNWNEANPLIESKPFAFEGVVTLAKVPKMRAMTLLALCMFIGITSETWREWKVSRPDLKAVIDWADAVIYRQKFEGAAADLLNASIIARDLGLADKRELTGANGGPVQVIDPTKLSTEALAELMAAMNAGAETDADGSAGD